MHGVGMDIATVLEQIKAGDDAAFETLIIQYEPLLHASVRRTVAKQPLLQEEQGEILQEARCALYRAALSFSVSQANVTFGLYAEICIRNALTSKFLRPLEKERFPLASIEEKERELVSPLEDALEALIQNESVSLLHAFIRRSLSPLEYQVFRLHEAGYHTSEIAKTLSRTPKSVENALARAIRKLRQLLAAE